MRNLTMRLVLVLLVLCSGVLAQSDPPMPSPLIRGLSWSDLRLSPDDLPVFPIPSPQYGLEPITWENADQVRLLKVISARPGYANRYDEPIISSDSRFLYVSEVALDPNQRKPMWHLTRLHTPRTFGSEQISVTGHDHVFAGITAYGERISLMNVETGLITEGTTPRLDGERVSLEINADTILAIGWQQTHVLNRADLALRFTLPHAIVAFSPNGRQIIARTANDRLTVYDAFTGEPCLELVIPLPNPYQQIAEWAIDPNNQMIVISGNGLSRWDLTTGAALPLETDMGGVSSMRFSPDGRWLALINANRFNLIDTRDGSLWFSLYFEDETDYFNQNQITFSPNGRLLLLNNPLRLLNLLTGEVQAFVGLYRSARATFSPDSATIVAYDRNLVLIFGVPKGIRPAWPGVDAQVIPSSVSIRHSPRRSAYEVGFGIGTIRIIGAFDSYFVQVSDPAGWTWAEYLDFGPVKVSDLPRVMTP
ncbi:MAG: hypothetical protein MUF87_10060 [Anaerolineae bacterium]|nr:hypothetical protein [Anaerolineae bacterium]